MGQTFWQAGEGGAAVVIQAFIWQYGTGEEERQTIWLGATTPSDYATVVKIKDLQYNTIISKVHMYVPQFPLGITFC